MTYEEARQSILTYCVEECGKIEACKFDMFNNCCEALAITALNKQIPRKPEHIYVYHYRSQGSCAECKHHVDVSYTFCPHCGQAIDWEKEDTDVH